MFDSNLGLSKQLLNIYYYSFSVVVRPPGAQYWSLKGRKNKLVKVIFFLKWFKVFYILLELVLLKLPSTLKINRSVGPEIFIFIMVWSSLSCYDLSLTFIIRNPHLRLKFTPNWFCKLKFEYKETPTNCEIFHF